LSKYTYSVFGIVRLHASCLNQRVGGWILFLSSGSQEIVPCGGGLEYLHRKPTSCKRRRKGNPVSNETVIYVYGSFATLTSE
jgi:hypothetical protein